MNNRKKGILIFISYFVYIIIIGIIMASLKIDYNTISIKNKVMYNVITNGFYLLLLILFFKKELKEELKLLKTNYKDYFIKSILIFLAGALLMFISTLIISKFTGQSISGNETEIRNFIKNSPLLTIILAVIISPIIEELVFRKAIKNIFNNKYLFIIISSLIFGLLHVSSIRDINELLFSIPYIIMGISFAITYQKTNNIFTSIILHSSYNLVLILIQLF